MASRDTGNNILLVLLALGGAAVMALGPERWPTNAELFLWVGIVLVVIAVAGLLWLNLSRKKPSPKAASPSIPAPDPLAELQRDIARVHFLERFIPDVERKFGEAEKIYADMEALVAKGPVTGGEMGSTYGVVLAYQRRWKTVITELAESLEKRGGITPNFLKPPEPDSYLLVQYAQDENIGNSAGTGPDQDRKLRYRQFCARRANAFMEISALTNALNNELFVTNRRIETAAREGRPPPAPR